MCIVRSSTGAGIKFRMKSRTSENKDLLGPLGIQVPLARRPH